MEKQKAIFELFLVLVSVFAFAYILSQTDPLVEMVTATSPNFGCCETTKAGAPYQDTLQDNCEAGARFDAGVSCSNSAIAQQGCCIDSEVGVCSRNTYQSLCEGFFIPGQGNCQVPQCQTGCCDLGDSARITTETECEVYTEEHSIGENRIPDWDRSVSQYECINNAGPDRYGACTYTNPYGVSECKLGSEADCIQLTGDYEDFKEGYLCTSQEAGGFCDKTQETICLPGKDQVFYLDSCGNPANIYDSSKYNQDSYWEKIISEEDSCSFGNGNANSLSCGNCDRYSGGLCSSTLGTSLNPTHGDNYCKTTSCTDTDGKTYQNGESWCAYEGTIGEGNDVVGSRHYAKTCTLGEITIDACQDYRQEICVQSNLLEEEGGSYLHGYCRANNWRECILLNGQEDSADLNSLDCTTKSINGGGKYNVEFTVPQYPPGFFMREPENARSFIAGSSDEDICSLGSFSCTYAEEADFWGDCDAISDGKNCKSPQVLEQMNEFCRSLGDCGLSANVVGEVQQGCKVNRGSFSDEYKSMLSSLKNPVDGQFAAEGDISKYLDAAGIYRPDASLPDDDWEEKLKETTSSIGMGAGLAGYYLGFQYGIVTGVAEAFGGSSTILYKVPGLNAFGGAMIGAVAGAWVGAWAARELDAPEGYAQIATYAGAVAGAAIGVGAVSQSLTILQAMSWGVGFGPIGWIALGVMVLALALGSIFGEDCEVTTIEYTCEKWAPPAGGADCEKCNDFELGCSDYKCNSLGASCEIINRGSDDVKCVAKEFEPNAPTVESLTPSEGLMVTPTSTGVELKLDNGNCLTPYEGYTITLTTNELAQCYYHLKPETFENMSQNGASFGTNSFVTDHTETISFQDPTHGVSQGLEFSKDQTIYTLCQDIHGNKMPKHYAISTCVEQGKDERHPTIKLIRPKTTELLSYNATELALNIFTNEPSECKFSTNTEQTFENMLGTMDCPDSVRDAPYKCDAKIPIVNSTTDVYVSCKDQPWLKGINEEERNTMPPQKITFQKVSAPIKITSMAPTEDLETNTPYRETTLSIRTADGGRYHTCHYSFSGYDEMIPFIPSSNKEHTQTLDFLPVGDHEIFFKCNDETGDSAKSSTTFEVIYDDKEPQITRTYVQGSLLYLYTDEPSTCLYTNDDCKYQESDATPMGSGIEHSTSYISGETYYVKCKDEWDNLPTKCSMIITPSES